MLRKLIRKRSGTDWIALGLITCLMIFFLWSLAAVPFHPDESTQIYMSQDLPSLVSDPLSLAWDGSLPLNPEERYRAIDAPLTKYLVGLVRGILSIPPLESDWNWAASWQENIIAGALPSRNQLISARAVLTLVLGIGLWFYYLALKRSLPGWPALVGLALLGLNPLLLLHGRRAMSEGVLLFSVSFFLWAATREKRAPWLIGLALACALNSKLTAAALLPAGLLAVCLGSDRLLSFKKAAGRSLQLLGVILLVSAVLNPFFWRKPLQALEVGSKTRMALSEAQQADHLINRGLPELTLTDKGMALLANLYFTAPQIEEAGNYTADIEPTRQRYLNQPFYSWGRSPIPGALFLILALVGFILGVRRSLSNPSGDQGVDLVWILASLGLFGILLLPIPWQRYVVPLLPFSAYWIVRFLDPLRDYLADQGWLG